MELAFLVNVARENTRSKLTRFHVPVVAKLLPLQTIELSTGPMKAVEIQEVIDWKQVFDNANELASYHFQLLNPSTNDDHSTGSRTYLAAVQKV
jgi:hypothetical protein